MGKPKTQQVKQVPLLVSRAILITDAERVDRIILTLEGVTGFPTMKYETTANIEVEQGRGKIVCLELGVEPEVIDVTATRVPFK